MSYTMTTTEAIAESYLRATGKAVSPLITDSKGVKLLALLNHYTRQWARSDWRSMRSTFTVLSPATVTATDTFAIPATVHHISQQEGDYVRIYHAGGTQETDYTIVPIDHLYEDGTILGVTGGGDKVSIVGTNLVFQGAFTADSPQFGGTIKIPGYSIPSTLTLGADVLQVDDPQWLTVRVAAEYVRNDRTRVQLFDSLLEEAQLLWNQMVAKEESQIEEAYMGDFQPLGETF